MENQFQHNYDRMHQDYYDSCGRIMDIANFLEMMLSQLLYQIKRLDNNKLNPIEIDNLTFDEKRNLFEELKKEGKSTELKPYKGIIGDIDVIKRIRNLFAHSTLHTDKKNVVNYTGQTIFLIKHKADKGLESHTINIRKRDENLNNNTLSLIKSIDRANKLKKWFDSILSE